MCANISPKASRAPSHRGETACATPAAPHWRERAGTLTRMAEALRLLMEVDARLRFQGFTRLRAALPEAPVNGGEPPDSATIDAVRRMARALRRAALLVPRAQCLHRALALLLWLRRRGIPAELRVGVRPAGTAPGARIEGHAWIEWAGIPLDEAPDVCRSFALLTAPTGPSVDRGESPAQ